MADQTICMACLPQKKKESCSISNNLPPGPGSCGCNHHGDKVVLVADTVCSCSTLCDGIGDNTKQYNGIQQPETGFLFSNSKDVKESKNVKKFRDDCKEHGCMSSMCLSQVCQSQASHTSTIKINSLDKCNGLTHQHIGDEYYSKKNVCDVVNVPNIKYNGEEAVGNHGNEINSLKRDSDSEPCHCTAKVDSDYVSCDEIEAENIHSPEMHCHNNCSVNTTLLTNFERISIHQLNNASEHYTVSDDVINGITYAVYESEKQMPDIMRLITKDLSEPYSIYTYRYFIHNWPKLCFLALCDTHCIGAIVCKLDSHKKMVRRGYIAMLAVDSEYRRRKIGSILVTKAIEAMIRDDCDEVVLETEITNQSALHLYENLGFVRDKRLFRYYLNGVDALRLKLWLR